ncbi:unnamed protein product [Linum trigynum]|uniref:Uncharacterized protein n=1 Tax=Linum trigynum TaxID=586398 RepID=A0AAV2EBJ4_9ROSI
MINCRWVWDGIELGLCLYDAAFLSRGGRLEQGSMRLRIREEERQSGAGISSTFRRSRVAREEGKRNDGATEQGCSCCHQLDGLARYLIEPLTFSIFPTNACC